MTSVSCQRKLTLIVRGWITSEGKNPAQWNLFGCNLYLERFYLIKPHLIIRVTQPDVPVPNLNVSLLPFPFRYEGNFKGINFILSILFSLSEILNFEQEVQTEV